VLRLPAGSPGVRNRSAGELGHQHRVGEVPDPREPDESLARAGQRLALASESDPDTTFIGGHRIMEPSAAQPQDDNEGATVSGPFIFIATNRIRDGRYGAEQQRVPELARFIEASEPRLIAFNEYVDDDHSEVTVVQVHPDAASLEYHMGIIGDRAREAYAQTLQATTRIQVFGRPTGNILRMLEQQAGSGVPLSIYAHHLGGFTRASEG
jgi:hypothetical protein